jgi:hypothetical protein
MRERSTHQVSHPHHHGCRGRWRTTPGHLMFDCWQLSGVEEAGGLFAQRVPIWVCSTCCIAHQCCHKASSKPGTPCREPALRDSC